MNYLAENYELNEIVEVTVKTLKETIMSCINEIKPMLKKEKATIEGSISYIEHQEMPESVKNADGVCEGLYVRIDSGINEVNYLPNSSILVWNNFAGIMEFNPIKSADGSDGEKVTVEIGKEKDVIVYNEEQMSRIIYTNGMSFKYDSNEEKITCIWGFEKLYNRIFQPNVEIICGLVREELKLCNNVYDVSFYEGDEYGYKYEEHPGLNTFNGIKFEYKV